MRFRLFSPVILLLAASCGPQVHAPSLAPRAVEQQPVEPPGPAREPETPVDPGLARRIAQLVAGAKEGDKAFLAARASAERAIEAARGAEPGSEAWTVAQQSLSALDVARGPVRDAATQVSALRLEPGASGTGNRTAIDDAQQRIEALDAAQGTAVENLHGRLR